MDAEKWLQKNGIECRPYGARISRAMCATYQQHADMAACPCPQAARGTKPLDLKRPAYRKGPNRCAEQGQTAPEPSQPAPMPRRRPQGPKPRRCAPAEPYIELEAELLRLAHSGHAASERLIRLMNSGGKS